MLLCILFGTTCILAVDCIGYILELVPFLGLGLLCCLGIRDLGLTINQPQQDNLPSYFQSMQMYVDKNFIM